MILGWVILKVWRFHKLSGLVLGGLLLLTNWMHVVPMQLLGLASVPPQTDATMLNYPNIPLQLYLTELVDGYPDVNQNLIEFFQKNAEPDDTILVTYSDLPLQFYTDLKVIGGLQDRIPEDGTLPDWVVKRQISRTNRDDLLVSSDDYILNRLDLGAHYEKLPQEFNDEMFGNRPDPYYHRFLPMSEPYQPIVIFKLKKETGA